MQPDRNVVLFARMPHVFAMHSKYSTGHNLPQCAAEQSKVILLL